MNIRTVNGRRLVCGHIYPLEQLKVGQMWAQADGADRCVRIRAIEGDNIIYGVYGSDRSMEKSYHDFQSRYCLVV